VTAHLLKMKHSCAAACRGLFKQAGVHTRVPIALASPVLREYPDPPIHDVIVIAHVYIQDPSYRPKSIFPPWTNKILD
jgi:hypothetical protein